MNNLDLDRVDDEYFKLFFGLSPDLFAISKQDGYFKHLNESWTKALGFSQAELLQDPYRELMHPEDVSKTEKILERLRNNEVIHNFENRFRCKDGSYRTLSWNAMMHSNQDLIFSVARDITEQKMLEAHLKDEKSEAETQTENIHMLLSQVPALAAATSGPGHVFTFANTEYCALIGNRSPVGMPVQDALPGLSEEIIKILDQVYTTGEKFTAENQPITADWKGDGRLTARCFTFIYSPLRRHSGEVYGIWCLAFDVTELKVMQQRLEISEKMASLGTIAAGVAHEINNPLAYVGGLLELTSRQIDRLQTETLVVDKAALLERIKGCGKGLDRIAKIVKSLKAFSRTDEETLEPMDIGEVLKATLQFADNEIKHRAKVILDIEAIPKCIGNESKLIQVFLNLIVNGAHAIPLGRVNENSITISAKVREISKIEISVTDTGCGISPENISKIFDPFYTSKPVGEGTGLGLSICHGIITSMNGTIQVESKVGVGTTFTLTLPAFEEAEKSIPASSPAFALSTPTLPSAATKPHNVLVIDDEVAFGEVIGLSLENDFEVKVVSSVHDALIEISKSQHFDVILCDLMMPYQTGMDLYYNLSRTAPGMQNNMVFMTGGVFTSEASEFLGRIENPLINKPFSMKDLRELILTKFQHHEKVA